MLDPARSLHGACKQALAPATYMVLVSQWQSRQVAPATYAGTGAILGTGNIMMLNNPPWPLHVPADQGSHGEPVDEP